MDDEDAAGQDASAELPEERLAFALGDGRVGVLAVRGRKVRTPRLLLMLPILQLSSANPSMSIDGLIYSQAPCLPGHAAPIAVEPGQSIDVNLRANSQLHTLPAWTCRPITIELGQSINVDLRTDIQSGTLPAWTCRVILQSSPANPFMLIYGLTYSQAPCLLGHAASICILQDQSCWAADRCTASGRIGLYKGSP